MLQGASYDGKENFRRKWLDSAEVVMIPCTGLRVRMSWRRITGISSCCWEGRKFGNLQRRSAGSIAEYRFLELEIAQFVRCMGEFVNSQRVRSSDDQKA